MNYATPSKLAKSRVLIVEDDRFMAALLSDSLRRNGYEVVVATDGVVGAASGHEFKPHIAVIDYAMPGLNGLKVAERLRETEMSPLIVMITGLVYANLERRAKEFGIRQILQKPFKMEDLIHATEQCMGSMQPRKTPAAKVNPEMHMETSA